MAVLQWCPQGGSRSVNGTLFACARPQSETGDAGDAVLWPWRPAPGRSHPWDFWEPTRPKPVKVEKGVGWYSRRARVPPPFTAFTCFSVGGLQNCPRFRMLKHELPQQVVLLSAGFSQSAIPKAQVAVRIQAGRNAQAVR